MLETIFKILVAPLIIALSIAGYSFTTDKVGGNAVGGESYVIAGSGVSPSQTTISLTSFTIPGGDTKISMTDFGTLGCGTIEPGSRSKQEFISFTGVTQNSDGTATLTGVTRGLSPIPDYTASTTLQHAHAGGTSFVISNSPPCFYEGYANLGQDETVTGYWAVPTPDSASSTQIANVGYVNAIAFSGSATSSETLGGIVELGTQLEMASSTATNWTIQPRVVQSRYGTSTPDGTSQSGLYFPVSKNNGKLHQLWLDLTESFSFSGGLLNTASSTFTATTSITANSVTNNALVLNGINYAFPSVQGASSTILATNGSGSLTWQEGFVSKFYSSATNLTYTGGTATSTLLTLPIPANTLNEGTLLEISAFVDGVGATLGVLKYDIQFGNGSASSTIAYGELNSNTSVHEMKAKIKANNSLSSQLFYSETIRYNDTSIYYVRPGVTTYNNASQLYLSFRGAPANSGNTVTIYSVLVKKIK